MLRSFVLLIVLLVSSLGGRAQELSPQNDPEAIADLRVASGSKDIAKAWLIAPTTRYLHFVQGSKYEPSGLRVKLSTGQVLSLLLEDHLVFEDRQPRLADLDDDGRDEIILVLTDVDKGASLAAFSVENGALTLKAKTPFIGRPYRWLNPAGIGDFDGDGRMDVAFVAMPHLVKQLEVWSLEKGRFVRWGQFGNFSNHRNGSRHTGMSAQADFNGDGIIDLVLPAGDRQSIRFVTLAKRKSRAIKTAPLPSAADGTFILEEKAGSYSLLVPLADGNTVKLAL